MSDNLLPSKSNDGNSKEKNSAPLPSHLKVGSSIEKPSITPPQIVPSPARVEGKYCPYCDELISVNAIKCKHCQTTLADSFPNFAGSSPEKIGVSSSYEINSRRRLNQRRRNNFGTWFFCTIISLLCIGTPAYILLNQRGPEASSNQSSDSRNSQSLETSYGKVKVNLTYYYNKYVGNKPDGGAVVLLIPKGEKIDGIPSAMFTYSTKSMGKSLKEKGGYMQIAGGGGDAYFNRVVAGDYTLLAVSKYAKGGDFWYDVFSKKQLQSVLDKIPEKNLEKVYVEAITVMGNETFDRSHDFGATEW